MTTPRRTPYPKGPFLTGSLDLVTSLGRDGLLLRLYYPAQLSGNINDHKGNWAHWYQGEKYVEGLGRFYYPLVPQVYAYLADWITKDIRVPCVWEAPIHTGGDNSDQAFPVIVFSHGLTANRGTSSTICNDIASHGFIVAVIEHKDETACATFFLDKRGRKEWIPFRCLKSGEKQYPIRHYQLKTRVDETSRALDVLEKLNKNEVKNHLTCSFNLKTLKGRLDLSKPIVMGHSFGGATACVVLKKDPRFKSGILLDPWMFPLKHETKKMANELTKPMLFILMEAFQDQKNLEALKHFEKRRNTFVTIKGSPHQNQVDTPFLTNFIGRILMGCYSSIDPLLALKLNDRIIINFIWNQFGIAKEYSKDYENFIKENGAHLLYGAYGTGKSMLGWDSNE